MTPDEIESLVRRLVQERFNAIRNDLIDQHDAISNKDDDGDYRERVLHRTILEEIIRTLDV